MESRFTSIITKGNGFKNLTPVDRYGQLKVINKNLLDNCNRPVSLRGVSLGWHNWWPRFYNKVIMRELAKKWGCTVVRAAIGAEHNEGFIHKPIQSYELLKAVIEGCIENGIYVIVDWHSHHIHEEEAAVLFYRVSKEFGHYPNIIYEIFNEPVHQSWKRIKKYSMNIISTIRINDANNIILVGCPHWDQDIETVAKDPINGIENIMYTLHFYAASHKQNLRLKLENALSKELPVFISECGGMEANGNGPIDYPEWEKWMMLLNKHNLSWVAWSIADKDESCSMLKPSASSFGIWKDADIKEWGLSVREALMKYGQ